MLNLLFPDVETSGLKTTCNLAVNPYMHTHKFILQHLSKHLTAYLSI